MSFVLVDLFIAVNKKREPELPFLFGGHATLSPLYKLFFLLINNCRRQRLRGRGCLHRHHRR
jgi:hypothetical protein